jgi:hypothetical protein
MADFFSEYLAYAESASPEVPVTFHRWSILVGLGAYLGRDVWITHGHNQMLPNIYCMLMGDSGARKSTAIKLAKKIVGEAGYKHFAFTKTSKEQFLVDLAGDGEEVPSDILTYNIFGDEDKVCETLIAADEFNDFIGLGNMDFISLLGNLWDFSGTFDQRLKTGKSVSISNPTVSILAGNTPTGFALCFPPEALGQGFFSRLLLIHSDPSGRKVAWPEPPDLHQRSELVKHLQRIKLAVKGELGVDHSAKLLTTKIYESWKGLGDVRFGTYSTRRFGHLLKLLTVVTAARFGTSVSEYDVVLANTILSHAEHSMPKALGEFGKAKHSDVAHKIVTMLEASYKPLTVKEIWKGVSNDLDKISDLSDIMRALHQAEKVQITKIGFLPVRKVIQEVSDGTVDYSLLTQEERKYVA